MSLGARLGAERGGSESRAIAAGAIPLGKAAAGRGAENFDFHEGILPVASGDGKPGQGFGSAQTQNGPPPPQKSAATAGPTYTILEFGVGVRADFAVQIDFFVLRGDPFHGDGSLNSDYQFAGQQENNTGMRGREAGRSVRKEESRRTDVREKDEH